MLGPEPDERLDDVFETMSRTGFPDLHDPEQADDHVALRFDRLALVRGSVWTVPITGLDLTSDAVPTDSLGLLFVPLVNDRCTLDGGDSIDIDPHGRRRQAGEALGPSQVAASPSPSPRAGSPTTAPRPEVPSFCASTATS